MEIHVVRPGESLWAIARRYGVSVQNIIDANGIQDLPYLVPGQALIIPGIEATYTVQPGDSLWAISQRYGVTVESILDVNNIANPSLIYPGMVIKIPAQANQYGTIEVNAYIEPTSPEREREIINEVGQYLTYISPFSYQVNEEGNLNPIDDETILNTARQYDIAPLMVITNFRNGNFDSQLAHTILTNENVQQNLINNVLQTMENKGYYGLNIDFERIPPDDRELYNNFLRKVVQQLRPEGYVVSTALAPKPYDIRTGAWHGAHDYQAHGEIVDFVILMTYEWGWSGGPPLAVAPINRVREVVDYAASVIPPEKIILGMPLYGYDWRLPYTPRGDWAQRVSPKEAVEIAARYGAVINYDQESQAPYFYYVDEEGRRHVIWFEDVRSVMAKFNLVNEYGLRGVSYWVLGVPFPQNWQALDAMFNIEKLV
ncbi:LysM peptidoglycan-binding domain-containing protein [Thermohalobacter berrensis]|uniref:Spore gernimation protein n=1 Tax=Thermohalobacter berrensis TaxID=99594 RepID=A0A419SXU1_9FIRM|nr:glycoside hydrolase family 18 protein [Thermohalobacter berrensis]RKD30083.1 spore gernimation protein [Thermohalobacter berrensis]